MYVLALPIFVSLTASASGGYTLVLTMAATAPSFVQVFFDTGQGFSEGQSATAPVYASPEPLDTVSRSRTDSIGTFGLIQGQDQDVMTFAGPSFWHRTAPRASSFRPRP